MVLEEWPPVVGPKGALLPTAAGVGGRAVSSATPKTACEARTPRARLPPEAAMAAPGLAAGGARCHECRPRVQRGIPTPGSRQATGCAALTSATRSTAPKQWWQSLSAAIRWRCVRPQRPRRRTTRSASTAGRMRSGSFVGSAQRDSIIGRQRGNPLVSGGRSRQGQGPRAGQELARLDGRRAVRAVLGEPHARRLARCEAGGLLRPHSLPLRLPLAAQPGRPGRGGRWAHIGGRRERRHHADRLRPLLGRGR